MEQHIFMSTVISLHMIQGGGGCGGGVTIEEGPFHILSSSSVLTYEKHFPWIPCTVHRLPMGKQILFPQFYLLVQLMVNIIVCYP